MTSHRDNPYQAFDETATFGQAPVARRDRPYIDDGECLIVPINVKELPRRCPLCDAPAVEKPLRFTLRAMSTLLRAGLIFLAIFQPLLLFLVLLLVKKIRLKIYLCPTHNAQEKRRRAIQSCVLGLGVGLFLVGILLWNESVGLPVGLLGLVTLIAGSLVIAFLPGPLRLKAIKQKRAYLLGTHPDFRAQFAQPEQLAAPGRRTG